MDTTIFTTPVLTPLLRKLSQIVLRLIGWRVVGEMPDIPRFVLAGAPHTSNWDFVIFLAMALVLRADVHYMGKASLFRWPLGGFFRWCGGYPVERSKPQGLVDQMVKAMQESERFILTITPEGTRNKVKEWKTGFYHIARKAGVPIVTGYVDSRTKTCGIGSTFILTDDIDADMNAIKSFFAGKVGIHPAKTSEIEIESHYHLE
jgi:1-acyl-sn-glycerol-3-phosphate acyltransferase